MSAGSSWTPSGYADPGAGGAPAWGGLPFPAAVARPEPEGGTGQGGLRSPDPHPPRRLCIRPRPPHQVRAVDGRSAGMRPRHRALPPLGSRSPRHPSRQSREYRCHRPQPISPAPTRHRRSHERHSDGSRRHDRRRHPVHVGGPDLARPRRGGRPAAAWRRRSTRPRSSSSSTCARSRMSFRGRRGVTEQASLTTFWPTSPSAEPHPSPAQS
jgi:hypothetical protein